MQEARTGGERSRAVGLQHLHDGPDGIPASADTFYLDGAAHLLEATMKGLGARTDFRYVEGRGHFDLYAVGDDPRGLYKVIAWEMYALARPGSKPPHVSAAPLPAPARGGMPALRFPQ